MHAERTEAFSPAYVKVAIDQPEEADEPEKRETWLMAEAWWGDLVQAPPPVRLLSWLLERGPLLVYWHFYPYKKTSERITALAIAGSMQVLTLTAMVLYLIPVGPWRRAVLSVLRTLTSTLGDSFVLLEQDFQLAALVTRAQQSLEWISERAGKVIVVAHSQGAMIAHDAIRKSQPATLAAFISVGSGFEKLMFLRHVRGNRLGETSAMVLAPLTTLVLIVLAAGVTGLLSVLSTVIVGLPLVVICLYNIATLSEAFETYTAGIRDHLQQCRIDHAEWHDLFASHDLVPMGKRSALADVDFVTRHEVENQRSYLRDHTGYFGNRLGFVPTLLNVIVRHSRLRSILELDDSEIARLSDMHRARVRVLRGSPVALVLCYLVVALSRIDLLAGMGSRIRTALETVHLTAVTRPMPFVGNALAGVATRTGMPGTLRHAAWDADFALGSLSAAVLVFVWWVVFRTIWLAGEEADFHRIWSSKELFYEQAIWNDKKSSLRWVALGVLVPCAVAIGIILMTR